MGDPKFKEILGEIPNSYAISKEQIDREISSTEAPSLESAEKLISIIDALSVMPDSPESREDQIRLLARITTMINGLRREQNDLRPDLDFTGTNKNSKPDPKFQMLIGRLVKEKDRIEGLRNS
ncbi:MAG: hypothetical protein HY506_00955 [Candidatus Yanofskybacteria bacterium]|nr:hypothetical protein [Candidatus Yanofskybacteria bacterium]